MSEIKKIPGRTAKDLDLYRTANKLLGVDPVQRVKDLVGRTQQERSQADAGPVEAIHSPILEASDSHPEPSPADQARDVTSGRFMKTGKQVGI